MFAKPSLLGVKSFNNILMEAIVSQPWNLKYVDYANSHVVKYFNCQLNFKILNQYYATLGHFNQ